MRFDISQCKSQRRRERRRRLLRTITAAAGSVSAAAAGLTFGFAMGLQDVRWAGGLAEAAHAHSLFSGSETRDPSPVAGSLI